MSSTPHFEADSLLAHAGALRILARALTWDDSTAEDLVQETWLVALEKQPPTREGLGPWLRAVLRRRAAHKVRAEATRRSREQATSVSEASVDERKLIVSALTNELMQLDEPYQTTLFLRFFEERSVLEIARHFETTTGTVGSRIHRGLEILRRRLDARSDGKRESWLGALAPFTDPKVRGLIMSGNAKIGVAAAVLCVVVLLVLQPGEPEPLPAALDGPSETKLAVVDKPRIETILEAPNSENKPTTEPQVVADQEHVDAPPKVQVAAADIPIFPGVEFPPPNEWTPTKNKIKREFSLEFDFKPSRFRQRFPRPNGTFQDNAIEWKHTQSLNTTDVIASSNVNADFRRKHTGRWKSKLTTFANADDSRWVKRESYSAAEVSPLHKRDLMFHHDLEEGWRTATKTHKKKDPADLLAELRADMNLTMLRPAESLQVGAQWRIEDGPLRNIFQPAGDLRIHDKIKRKRKDRSLDGMETLLTRFENPIGLLELNYNHRSAHTSTVDGVLDEERLRGYLVDANLDVTFTNDVNLDGSAMRRAGLERFEQRIHFIGQGNYFWDSEAEFVGSLSLSGTVSIVRTMKFEGQDEYEDWHRGTFELKLTNERR